MRPAFSLSSPVEVLEDWEAICFVWGGGAPRSPAMSIDWPHASQAWAAGAGVKRGDEGVEAGWPRACEG